MLSRMPGPTQYNTDVKDPAPLLQSRLGELGLQSIDVDSAGDCFFRSVSHQLYGNSNHHMHIRTAGVQFMRDNPERFIGSNTENSRLRYLNNMCIYMG